MKVVRYLRWLLTDGRYMVVERQVCGLCGSVYFIKIMIPTYLYNDFWAKWGLCDRCRKESEE